MNFFTKPNEIHKNVIFNDISKDISRHIESTKIKQYNCRNVGIDKKTKHNTCKVSWMIKREIRGS